MNKKIIIGSTAIRHWFPDFNRDPKDLDYAVESTEGFKTSREIEYVPNPIIFKYEDGEYLKPDLLLTLKMSHLFWDINWEKHIFDVQFLLGKGCKYNPELFEELVAYWTVHHPNERRSKLDMTKEDFFNNAINSDAEHEHDYLHTLINPSPTYKKVLKDGADVDVDEEKWNELSHEDKKAIIYEEVYIMAYERYRKVLKFRSAYAKMLKKYLMLHAPRYVAMFGIMNHREIHKPEYDFVKKINESLDESLVQIQGKA